MGRYKKVTPIRLVREQLRSQKYQAHIKQMARYMARLQQATRVLIDEGYKDIPEIRWLRIQKVSRPRFGEPFHTVPGITFSGEWLRSIGFIENTEVCTFHIDENMFICIPGKKQLSTT
jgi:hypothetical protein